MKTHKMILLDLFGSKCVYCGDQGKTIDHVFPRSKGGGKLGLRNKVIACEECNRMKGNQTAVEFLSRCETILRRFKYI